MLRRRGSTPPLPPARPVAACCPRAAPAAASAEGSPGLPRLVPPMVAQAEQLAEAGITASHVAATALSVMGKKEAQSIVA